ERFGEFFPVRFEQFKRKTVRHAFDHPRFGKGLKRAEHDRVAFAAEIDAQIGVPTDGKFIEGAVDRRGDDVMVFDRVERNGGAATEAEFAGPYSAGEDDMVGFDVNVGQSSRLPICGFGYSLVGPGTSPG